MLRRTVLLVTGVGLLTAACTMPPSATGLDPDTAPRAGEPAYADRGPHPVGVTTLSLGDRSVEVWYPADPEGIGDTPRESYFIRDFVPPSFDALIPPEVDPPYLTDAYRDVPAAPGSHPLSIFSHGAASFRLQSTELTTHLASWGFVVISPDYLERGLANVLGSPPAAPKVDTLVAELAIDAVIAAGDDPGSLLAGVVQPFRVFAFGHSAGGGTSLRLLGRPDVDTAVPMAAGITPLSVISGTAPPLPPGESVTWIAGQSDGIASIDGVRGGYDLTRGEKKIIEIRGAGHNNAFTDICEIGDGGVVQLAVATGLPIPTQLLALGDDGCRVPPFRESAEVWPEVRHFVTAELRYRSGLDTEPVGLGRQVVAAFDDVARYDHAP
jgi:hypothetical protein